VLTIVGILREIGPDITEPHAKPVKGMSKLYELRPGGGKVTVRPLYVRYDDRTFKILAIAPESQIDPSGFAAAVDRARRRADEDYSIDA
jgi:hypothetical protein